MADTQTPNLLLTNQTEGGNNNTWGQIADTNFETIDNKFGDVTAVSTTGGTTTLTSTQEVVNAFTISGALVSNATIVFSGRGGTWVVKNSTTGSYTVTLKVSGQTGVAIEQGTKQGVFCNGTDIETAGGPSNSSTIPTGAVSPYVGTTSPSGWVRANARTIGSAASSATERANADTETLYTLLWNEHSNTVLAIQDSAGTPTTRGASAAADFAANKRLPLPDLRGRTWFGLDTMGNSAASRLGTIMTSATTNGSSGGTETVVLITANLPSHSHSLASHTHTFSATTGSESVGHTHSVSITTGTESASHSHTFSGSTSSDGAHTHDYSQPQTGGNTGSGPEISAGTPATGTTTSSGTHSHTFSGSTSGNSVNHTHLVSGTTANRSAAHTHDVSGTTAAAAGSTGGTGSDTAHSNMPPCWLGTFIIKL